MGIKWFQHHSESHSNLKMKKVLRNYGLVGYALVWIVREFVAKEGKAWRVAKEKEWFESLKEVTGLEDKPLQEMIDYQAEISLIDGKALAKGDLYIPKFREYADDYTKRKQRDSGQSSNKVPQDKIRLNKIIEEYIRLKEYDAKEFTKNDWASCYTAAAQLMTRAEKLEDALGALKWVSRQTYMEWTIFTAVKKFPDYLLERQRGVNVASVESLVE